MIFWILVDVSVFGPLDPLNEPRGPENPIPEPQIYPDTTSEPERRPGGPKNKFLMVFGHLKALEKARFG